LLKCKDDFAKANLPVNGQSCVGERFTAEKTALPASQTGGAQRWPKPLHQALSLITTPPESARHNAYASIPSY